MRVKHLFVLIYIRIRVWLAPSNMFFPSSYFLTDSSKVVLLIVWAILLFLFRVGRLSYCLVCSLQPCGYLLGKG